MDFTGRHHHHSRREDSRRGDNDVEDYPAPPSAPPFDSDPPPPPPSYYREDEAPQRVTHVSHTSHFNYPAPPPPQNFTAPIGHRPLPPSHYYGRPPQSVTHDLNSTYPPPHAAAAAASVQHVSHDVGETGRYDGRKDPHHTQTHTHTQDVSSDPLLSKPTVRVFCKVKDEYSLAIREGMVVLARSDHRDGLQQWIKDEKYSTRVKDKEEFPSFALVNKATGQAIKHSIGNSHPVQLINYNPEAFDESILWSESRDLGDGFRTIRMINNIQLNFTVSQKDRWHGGVHEGTPIVLGDWKKGDNQRWKIIPYCKMYVFYPKLACQRCCVNLWKNKVWE